MLTFIYQWIQNIAFYLILLVAVMQMIPNNGYKKYVRFFAGMILILMLAGPILKLFDIDMYHSGEYQDAMREIEKADVYIDSVIGEGDALGD